MQRRIFTPVLALVTLFLSASVLPSAEFNPLKESSTSDQEDLATISQFYIGGVWRYLQVWPTQISPGDSLYFCDYDLNTVDTPFFYPGYSKRQQTIIEATLSISGRKVVEYKEQPINIHVFPRSSSTFNQQNSNAPTLCNIRPGERSIIGSRVWEIPLKLNNEFRNQVANKPCELTISTYDVYNDGSKSAPRIFKFPISLTPRKEEDSNLLIDWKDRSKALKESSTRRSSGTNAVEDSNQRNLRHLVNPNFDYSNPELLEEKWAEIENQTPPGVLQDEIHFARMLVSYFNEADDQKALSKQNEFLSWLFARPEPLRYSLIDRFYVINNFTEPKYRQRHFALLYALYQQEPNETLRRHINLSALFMSTKEYTHDDQISFAEFHDIVDTNIHSVLEVWPVNVKVGDPIYCRHYLKNVSPNVVKDYPIPSVIPQFTIHANKDERSWGTKTTNLIQTNPIQSALSKASESAFTSQSKDIDVNQIAGQTVATIRFPSAEQINSKFWKEARSESYFQPLSISVDDAYYFLKDRDGKYHSQFAQVETFMRHLTIKLNPRSQSELDLLKDWNSKASAVDPSSLFGLAKERPDDLTGAFLRLGNPFPHYPNAPDTVDGWKSLEDQIEPSALRDEVAFCRMIMEYYDEQDDEAAAKLLKSLSEWLESRPAPQRFGLIESIHYGQYGEETNEVYKARRQNIVDLFDQLTDGEYSMRLKIQSNAQESKD